MSRKYDSGCAKRLKKKETQTLIKEAEVKNKKITSFFSQSFGTSHNDNGPEEQGTSIGMLPVPTPSSSEEIASSSRSLASDVSVASDCNTNASDEDVDGVEDAFDITSSDIANWGPITKALQTFWVTNDFHACQNANDASDFSASARPYLDSTGTRRERKLSKTLFSRQMENGAIIPREWLCYSPSTGAVFCFPCVLFGTQEKSSSFKTGLSDWGHASARCREHENSAKHCTATIVWLTRAKFAGSEVNEQLRDQMLTEKLYWRSVLKRVVATVQFMAERGLAFRGDNEIIGSCHNGNYLGILELLGKFDPFLAGHISKYGNMGSGNVSYLSSQICEEMIQLMGNEVLNVIQKEIQEAKYFSISVDSTPDISHVDQLTFIIRYIDPNGDIKKRFVKFLEIEGHKGHYLYNSVIAVLESMHLDIANCRGQCYDNASNMSGVYNGVQALIKKDSPLAEWVPCAAHSLNLVCVSSIECCLMSTNFFGFVQQLYNFFSGSPARWSILLEGLQPNDRNRVEVLKNLSTTRWYSHAQATKALSGNYANILKTLKDIGSNENLNADCRTTAKSLAKKMASLEIAVLTLAWTKLLERCNAVSEQLQSVDLDLLTAVNLLTSLKEFVLSVRDQFSYFENKAKMLDSVSDSYKSDTKRQSKRKRQLDEHDDESTVQLTGSEKFRVDVFYQIIDKIVVELGKRVFQYKNVESNFGFIAKMQGQLSNEEILVSAEKLQVWYYLDLQPVFPDEMAHFCNYLIEHKSCAGMDKTAILTPRELFSLLRNERLQNVFPNVTIMLRIFLTLPVTNASGERSFSKLALLKNRLRSTMRQDRLNSLSIMSIENDVLRNISFEATIKAFSEKKCRKKCV